METMNTIDKGRPVVGVGAMIFKDGKVLLAKRKGAHGAGEYAFPGGHLEHMESFEECARRETKEECGIDIENVRFQFVANIKQYEPKHYLHIGVVADWKSGEPKVLEPKKAEHWDWYALTELPSPMFSMCMLAFDQANIGSICWDGEWSTGSHLFQ